MMSVLEIKRHVFLYRKACIRNNDCLLIQKYSEKDLPQYPTNSFFQMSEVFMLIIPFLQEDQYEKIIGGVPTIIINNVEEYSGLFVPQGYSRIDINVFDLKKIRIYSYDTFRVELSWPASVPAPMEDSEDIEIFIHIHGKIIRPVC